MTDLQLPAPLTPPDCDLRDFAFMPLDVLRLRDSDLAVKADGESFRCAVLLWCASWHQVPAASLPDDDDVLAQLAGFGRVTKEWLRHRDGALRGWVKCSDGRLYHPVVAEKATEAWRAKMVQRWKTECARIKKHNQRHDASVPVPDLDEWLSLGCPQGQPIAVPGTNANGQRDSGKSPPGRPPGVPRETHSKGQGEGQGQGQYLKEKEAAAASIAHARDPVENPAPPPAAGPFPLAERLAQLLDGWEAARGKTCAFRADEPLIQAWADAGVNEAELRLAYDKAVKRRLKAGDPAPVNVGLIDAILPEVRKGGGTQSALSRAQASEDPLAWALTASGLEAQGAALGLKQEPGELFPDFKARVHAAAGTTAADRARLLADYGVRV
ncbi:DUF1376 domain-containing protein [Bordetella hinzii]|uniref:DUF1376 domain-containing protein n=1 Tax=Bordetella hinzii TaxID=103855 RepID=UPI001C017F29|nr:DUF1376 domain-containing protein [Bordetella hinzii]QWF39283.1 DUF1376 domain-containing protein [Bordetella hinzii]QWF43830.1 DUF1376 domain-containing protein [Bordetella hinzii]QWF48366.1 DUF1376 domain-containing protein [Bordetella hinzii]QWF52903.1 DUF1376 domain-containing protein [Bordetella hinzii]QWF57392.1 DUF1376 domain-containing protein [Bordetella hinzii]